jgi:hypothetical protein
VKIMDLKFSRFHFIDEPHGQQRSRQLARLAGPLACQLHVDAVAYRRVAVLVGHVP